MAEVTKAELQAQLAEMTKRATAAETRVGQLTRDLEKVGDQHQQAAATVVEYGKQIDTLSEELRSANASLKAYKGSATKAKSQVTVLKKQLSPEPRPIGAMRPARNHEEVYAQAEALEAAFAADTTELVFSDGRREIRELAPLTITGDAWRETPQGRVLNAEPMLEPGDCQRESLDLRGFGLLNEAGEQVAYQALPDAIVVLRNQRVMLPANTIRF